MNENGKRLIVAVILTLFIVGALVYKGPSPVPPQTAPTVDEVIAKQAREARKEVEALEKQAKELREKAKRKE